MRGEQVAVVAAPEGGVEVDEVDPLRPRLLPAQGRLDRVTEALLRAGDALHELDGLAACDVDGGQQLEASSEPVEGGQSCGASRWV